VTWLFLAPCRTTKYGQGKERSRPSRRMRMGGSQWSAMGWRIILLAGRTVLQLLPIVNTLKQDGTQARHGRVHQENGGYASRFVLLAAEACECDVCEASAVWDLPTTVDVALRKERHWPTSRKPSSPRYRPEQSQVSSNLLKMQLNNPWTKGLFSFYHSS